MCAKHTVKITILVLFDYFFLKVISVLTGVVLAILYDKDLYVGTLRYKLTLFCFCFRRRGDFRMLTLSILDLSNSLQMFRRHC